MSTDDAGAHLSGATDRTDVRHTIALVGAASATLTVVVATAAAMVVVAALSLADGGWSDPRQGLIDALTFVGFASAIAMVVSYLVGIPVALALERQAGDRSLRRYLLYGVVGAGLGALVGAWLGGTRLAGLLAAAGLVAALGGAAGARWARTWPLASARRRGWAGTAALTVAALLAWLVSGLLFIPLLVAALVGGMTLAVSAAFRPPDTHRSPQR